jgi:hypothetical protein
MIPFCETPFHSEYKRLAAIVGAGKLKADHWDSWARIVDKFGWSLVIRCSDMCDPEKRWPAAIEALCIAQKFHQEQEAKEMEAREIAATRPPRPSNPAARAAQFQDIRTKYGV